MKKILSILLALSIMGGLVLASHTDEDTFGDYKQFKTDLENDNPKLWKFGFLMT